MTTHSPAAPGAADPGPGAPRRGLAWWLAGAAAVAMATTACSELGAGTGQISQRIGDVVHDPAAREVDLSRLTSFGWDHFHVFKPGTAREEICRAVGTDRNSCGRVFRYPAVPADHMALLFGLNHRLTHAELHAVANGQFDMVMGEEGVPKERSVFRIRRSMGANGQEAIFLEPR